MSDAGWKPCLDCGKETAQELRCYDCTESYLADDSPRDIARRGRVYWDDERIQVKIRRLHPEARLPTRATEGSSGLDLYALTVTERPYGFDITTGIAIELPEGYEAQVRPRSGLTRDGWMAALGTIDSDYRSDVQVTLLQLPGARMEGCRRLPDGSLEPWLVGMRVAQLVIQKVPRVELVEVDELSETARGALGFGSSGLR